MKLHTGLQSLTLVCAAALTAACGGSSGGTSSNPAGAGTAAPAPAVAFGAISGFGSIIVNGVRFDTSAATFEIDDVPGSEDDLDVGHVVLVRGTLDPNGTTGTAMSVEFDDNVEGPIQTGSIDVAAGTLIVLGQTVRTNADTSFDDSIPGQALAGLADGDVVEVSGYVDADGNILATRIELKNPGPGDDFEVTGIVSNHDAGAMTFMINALVVDYSSAVLEDFPGGTIDDGDLVEVEGLMINQAGDLIATEVEFEDDHVAGNDDDHVEIEGLITRFNDATDFDVSGFPVTTNNGTEFEGGVAGDLGLDVKVEVEGRLNANGVLVAREVDFRRDSVVEIEGLVDSVDAASGTVTVLGIPIHVDLLTRMEDDRDDVEPFGLGNIVAGDFIAVRGSEDPNAPGEVLAARLERDDGMIDETVLQGFVESVAEPSITILGVTIDTSGVAPQNFEDESDMPIGSAGFFGRPPDGELVKVEGTEVADTMIVADEVEFETP